MDIISPYKDIQQFTKIKILPHHMNSDIRNHMKFDDLLVRNSIKILLSSFLLFVGIYVLNGLFFTNISGNSVLLNSTLLLLMIFLAIIIYFGLVIMLKVLSVNQLREYLKK